MGPKARDLLVATLLACAALALAGCTALAASVPMPKHSPYPKSQTCAECHAKDKTHLPPYTGACDKCHGLTSWKTVIYSHAGDDFNQGRHGTLGCSRCHTEGSPPPSPKCGSCHIPPHGGWTNCVACHVPLTWLIRRPVPTKHLSLAGGHSNLVCFDCHKQAKTPSTPRTCVSCHGTKHGGLTNCAQCHDPKNGWKPGSFNHDVFFHITGRHTRLTCTQCHPRGRFAGTPAYCSGCHGSKHGGLTKCARCHTTSRFRPSTFRHSTVFRLSPGPHARLRCSRCHYRLQYAKVKGRTCVACHGRVHGFTTCTPCHSSTGVVIRVDHDRFFPLTGRHAALACVTCHGSPFKRSLGTHCVDCHGVKHGNQTLCGSCHTTSAFTPAKAITHPSPINLGTQHRTRACTLCHPTLTFNAATRPCRDCHTAPHVGPTDCLRCHRPTVWSEVHFTHPGLANGHGPADGLCTDCHAGGDFTNTAGWVGCSCHTP
jgi:hypothetical protein